MTSTLRTRVAVCRRRRGASLLAVDPLDARGSPAAEAELHDDDAAERAAGRAPRGSLDADRPRRDLVPRRLEEREAGPHRLRAPLRAHDVQGLEERRARRAPVVDLERRRPEQRLHQRRRDGLLADVPGAVPAARALARGRSHGVAAHRREGVQDRARGRQGRAADARREPALRPAERNRLRPGVHGPSLQAPDDRQHEGSRGGVDRGRARFLPHLLRAEQRDARASSATSTRRKRPSWCSSTSAACRSPTRPVPRDIPKEPPQTKERRVTARGELAAAGGRRRAPHHLRRPPRLVSAAHRVEGAVGRPELAHLPEAGLREAARARGVRRRQHHRGSEPVLRGGDRAAGPDARGGDQRADRGARSAAQRADLRRRSCSRPRTSSRATTSSAASRTRTRRASSATPSSFTTTSRPPTASSTSS